MSSLLEITPDLTIPASELTFTFSHSSKPGGQNVNKVSTRVTLHFDVAGSVYLSDMQCALIMERLRTRINKKGVLKVVSQRHRSQSANREAATARFIELVRGALEVTPPRKKSRISRAAAEERIREKKHRSRLKKERSKVYEPDE
jgi:ribosome-associated protein